MLQSNEFIQPRLTDRRFDNYMIPLELLKDLASLENGWLNGEGIGMDEERLIWIANIFESNDNPTLPHPYLYPTPSGGIQAEWSDDNCDISLEIDLQTKTGYYHSLHHDTGDIIEDRYDLTSDSDWQILNQQLADIFKV